jgi:uncharacterized CHY-type Zn-finger protein
MYVCSKCDKAIKAPSSVATYEDKFFHPECLACSVCTKSLNGRQFIKEKNGSLVCEECNLKTSPRCLKCKQVFAPGVTYKKLGDNLFYHNECFRCAGPCRGPIGADFYELDNDEFLCVSCYDKYGNEFEKYMDNPNGAAASPANNSPSKSAAAPSDKLANMSLKDSNVDKLPALQRERDSNPSNPSNTATAKPSTNTSTNPAAPGRSEKSPEGERLCAKCNQKLTGRILL